MGNTQTRPSANTAIEYEEDKSVLEMKGFAIMEAPVDNQLPVPPSPSSRSTSSRLRMFSTFQSAARPSTSSDDSHNRLKLSDILANGVTLATELGEYNADQIFIRRLACYEFKLKKPVQKMRILFCKNLDDLVFCQQQLGETVRNSIRMRPNMRVYPIGDKDPAVDGQVIEVEQEIYMPEEQSASRRLFAFMVHGDDDKLLLKARAIIMDESDTQKMAYIGAHMTERDEKMQTLARKITTGTIMECYDTEELAVFIEKQRSTPKPPTKYLIGLNDILLAFSIYEPANRDVIVANLILVATETTFLPSLAAAISTVHPIRVILMDLRGYGYSGGKRGHTPTVKTLFHDLRQIVRHVKGFSTKPVILGGFFYGGGIVANYDRFKKKEPVAGYVLISPIFGLQWRFAWRPELKAMQKEKIFDTKFGWFMLTKLTGGRVGGSKYVVDIKVDDGTYEFSPMHYSRMTANYVRSFQVEPNAFHKISAPTSIFMAENDEFLRTEFIHAKIAPQLDGDSQCFLQKGKTSIGMLMTMADDVADWITNLPAIKPWMLRVMKPREPVVSLLDLASVKAFVPKAVYVSIEKGIEGHLYDRAPRETDCHVCKTLTYDYWEPSYQPGRPLGVMLILAPRCQSHFLPTLAEHYRFIVFRMNCWHRDCLKCAVEPKSVWRVMQYAIKAIKANHPAAPLFIGGIGYGASLALGYSKHPQRQPVNGYVLVSPPLDASSAGNKEYVREGVERVADPSMLMFNEGAPPAINNPLRSQLEVLGRTGYVPHLVRDASSMYLSKNILEDIRRLDAPAAVFLPADHPYLHTCRLFEQLGIFLKPPFKMVSLMSGDMYSMLETIGTPLGHWLSQISTSVAPRAPLLLSNLTLNDFEPIEMIGKGTFGRVWLVRHVASSRFLALKVLDKETVVTQKQVKQVIREKDVLSECSSCPFIVSYVGSFQDAERLFLAMEFVIGGELFTRLNAVSRFPVAEARFYICEVIVALLYLHEREIVYRDLKPENIVLDAIGHIRLVDFGFARRLERGRCGSFCGSPYYIAPEMLSNAQYGKSVDLWALGVLLYELLTGGPPFSGKTANEVYKRILFSSIEVPSHVDSDGRDLIMSLLDPSPDTRLGCRKGILEVTRHRWFKGVDWDRVRNKQMPPPYQPQFTFDGDTANFVKFAGVTLEVIDQAVDKYDSLFKGY